MNIIEKMKARGLIPKAVLYARYSSENQRDESIDAQLRAMTEYCRYNGIIVVGKYIDRARSATTDDRPEFRQMITDSKKHSFNIVLVHKLDRFARNRYDSGTYRQKLKSQGVFLQSVLENLDDSPESVMTEAVIEGMNEYYSKNLAREVRKGQNENALSCRHNGGRPPFGYSVNADTLKYEIVESEAEAVRYIFEKISEGRSYGDVIEHLNKMGFTTRNGNPFGKNSLNDMLKNEKYRGVYVFNRRASKEPDGHFNSRLNKFEDEIVKIENGMPRIVSDELWYSVNKVMVSRKKLKNYATKKNTYLLTGKIFCGNCGSAFSGGVRYSGKKHTPYASYTCVKKKNHGESKCKTKEIRKEYIEEYVLKEILRMVISDDKIPELIKNYQAYWEKRRDGGDEEIQAIKKNIKACEGKIKNLVDVISQTGSAALIEALEKCEQEKETLVSELVITDHDLQATMLSDEEVEHAYKKAREMFLTGTTEDKRQLISLYLDKVMVFDNYVEVYINALPLYIREKIAKKYRNLNTKIEIAECFVRGGQNRYFYLSPIQHRYIIIFLFVY